MNFTGRFPIKLGGNTSEHQWGSAAMPLNSIGAPTGESQWGFFRFQWHVNYQWYPVVSSGTRRIPPKYTGRNPVPEGISSLGAFALLDTAGEMRFTKLDLIQDVYGT